MKFSPLCFLYLCPLFASLCFYSGPGTAKAQNTESNASKHQKIQSFQLLMAGGGLRVCSNKEVQYCTNSAAEYLSKQQNLKNYHLTEKSFSSVMQTPGFQQLPQATRTGLKRVFQYFYANPINVNSPEEVRLAFKAAIDDFDAGRLFNNLPNEVYYAILDYAQRTTSYAIEVNLAKSKSTATRDIFREFVQQADFKRNAKSPLTLTFITAASRDPFASVNYYQQIFHQAVKKSAIQNYTVNWLPLDQSLIQALHDKAKGLNSCEKLDLYRNNNQLFNAPTRYPQLTKTQQMLCESPRKLQQMLHSSHGLFITGGDPMRLLSLFQDSRYNATDYQQIITDKVQNGSLFLAGTGTGAAIMAGGVFENRPVPYITSGTSEVALIRGAFPLAPAPFGCEKDGTCLYGLLEDDLTYESRGGIGSFTLGTVDSRFSEQNREARLAVLTAASKTRFGFGIDENTALLFTNTQNGDSRMQVTGENGVFIVDMRDAIVKTQAGKHQIIGLSHYLNNSDQVSYSVSEKELRFHFASDSKKLNSKTMVLPLAKGEFRRNVAINCGTLSFHRWTQNNIAWLINPTEDTEFFIKPLGDLEKCSYNNLLFGIEN